MARGAFQPSPLQYSGRIEVQYVYTPYIHTCRLSGSRVPPPSIFHGPIQPDLVPVGSGEFPWHRAPMGHVRFVTTTIRDALTLCIKVAYELALLPQ